MYTILIVEDEMFVSLGIVNSIDWAAHGFERPLTAVNGREAWEMMQRQTVHVVMTDIKMPEMDGLQLIKIIREFDYQTEVIILSSYTDFEYVSGALELQTCSYLHKPAMMPADIALAIDKAVVRIESLKQRELSVKQMEHLYQTSEGKLKERALLDLVNGVERSEKELDDISFHVDMQECYAAIVHLNNGVSILKSKFNGDTSLFVFTLGNVVNELFTNDFRYECVCRAPDLICLVFNEPGNEKVWKQLKERFGMLSRVFATYLELDITMVMQAKPDHLRHLSRTVMSLLVLVNKEEHRLPNGRILIADGTEDPQFTFENDWTEWLEQEWLEQEWFSGGSQPEEERIVRVYHELERRNAPYKQALETSFMLLGFMLQYTASYPGVVAAIYRKEPEIYSRLQLMGSIADMERYMVRIWDEIECLIHNSRPPEIEKAVRYIHSHLSDHHLGLESTAAYVNISRNHFSRIFKEHTNKTFNKYVTNARIQLAEHLYRTTELKVYEIAEKVGYPNWRYFSKVYRKVKGKHLSQLNSKPKSDITTPL